jgi:AICAR transformylase/IMP cyclohydrolase PurH
VIQPGGWVRDEVGVSGCDALGVAMVFPRHRHFRH